MSFIAKLSIGGKSLDLNGSTFAVAASFAPPATTADPLLAYGTSANRRGGSTKVGERANDIGVTLPIYISGTSAPEIQGARRQLASFMQYAGQSEDDPLIFEWRGTNATAVETIYGQLGANLRYEITHANPPKSWGYHGVADYRKNKELVQIKCLFKPYAKGIKQPLSKAAGGVLEDKIGQANGLSRGLIVPPAATNLITNPVFGHTTYNTAWTTSANMYDTENFDPRFILFGTSSVLLHTIADGMAYSVTGGLDVGDTDGYIVSCYVKKQNSSAVTVADCAMYYAPSALSTVYTEVGDGWYRLWAKFTGIAVATPVGIMVNRVAGGIYVDGIQVEKHADHATPLCHGDMLGCSWSGTAHESSSVRVVGRMILDPDGVFNNVQGTIRVAVKSPFAPNVYNTSQYLFRVDGTSHDLFAYWDDTAADWEFSDGTTTITTTGITYAAGSVSVLHFTWSPAGFAIYVNGTSEVTSATAVLVSDGATEFNIGTSAAGTGPSVFTFMDFAIFDMPMSAAQVAADYADVQPLFASDQRGSTIPWLWTKDGDAVVDNCDDATRDNYCIIDGIPGTVPARTYWEITSSVDLYSVDSVWLYNAILDEYMSHGYLLSDLSGTPAVGTGSGDAVETIALAQTTLYRYTNAGVGPILDQVEGMEYYVQARMQDHGADEITVAAALEIGSSLSISKSITYTTSANYLLLRTPAITIPRLSRPKLGRTADKRFALAFSRTSGTENVLLDYFVVMPRPMIRFDTNAHAGAGAIILYDGKTARKSTTGSEIEEDIPIFGDRVELIPNKINMVSMLQGDETGIALTDTATIVAKVEPRWSVA